MARIARDEDNRQKILDAAADLVAESGVRKASLRAVSERAGVSAGTLYYYFNTKDELLASLSHFTTSNLASLAERARSGEMTRDELCDELAKLFHRRVLDQRSTSIYLHMLNEGVAGNEKVMEIVQEQNDEWIDSLEEIVSAYRGTPIGLETRSSAIAIEALAQGMMTQYYLNADYEDRQTMLQAIMAGISSMLRQFLDLSR